MCFFSYYSHHNAAAAAKDNAAAQRQMMERSNMWHAFIDRGILAIDAVYLDRIGEYVPVVWGETRIPRVQRKKTLSD